MIRQALSDQDNSVLGEVRSLRDRLIDLSYRLPESPSRAVLDAWSLADKGLYDLGRALKEAKSDE